MIKQNNIYKWKFIPDKKKQDPYKEIIPTLQELSKNFLQKSEEEQEIILDKMLKMIREINIFPIIYFNEQGIQEEIQSVLSKKDICIIDNSVYTQLRNGLLLLDFLFPNLHLATTCNIKQNIYERFYDDNILKFCLKRYLLSGNTLNNLRTVFFSTARLYWDTPINFSPMRAKIIFEKFCPPGGVIYDYSAGFGGRMLGALGSDKDFIYIGTDPNTNTYNNLLTLGEEIEKVTKRKNSYKIFNLCSEQLKLKENSVDFIFSCPPFFNKENYSDEPTQSIQKFPNYYDWLEKYVRKTIQNCYSALKENGVYSVDILDYFYSGKKIPLVEDWCQIAQEEGFILKQKLLVNSHFRKNKEDQTTKEYIYLFMKKEELNLPNYITEDVMNKSVEAKIEREKKSFRRNNITICEYNIFGDLIKSYNSYEEIPLDKNILKSKKCYQNKYYRIYYGDDIIFTQIDVKQPLAQVDEQYFYGYSDLGRYLNVSRQAIHQAYKNKSSKIINKNIKWLK